MGDVSPVPQYGLPFDRESSRFKAFCAKQAFTLEEFACLLANIDPASFDGSPESNTVFEAKAGGFLQLLQEREEKCHIDKKWFPPDEGWGPIPDYEYTFCGHHRDENGQYSVKAYRKFCALVGIPFPAGEERFTISEAAGLMLDLEIESVLTSSGECTQYHLYPEQEDEYGAAMKLQEWLLAQVKHCSNSEYPCYVLEGYAWVNPVDMYPPGRAEFPREAYYRLWLAHPMGLARPRWFAGLSRDTLPAVPALPAVVVKALGECLPSRPEPSPAVKKADDTVAPSVPAPATTAAVKDAELIADGVTVADVRALFDEKGKRYRAPLAEAVRLWASFEHDPKINLASVKQECKDRIKEARYPDGNKELWSENENDCLINLVNWDRTGNGIKKNKG